LQVDKIKKAYKALGLPQDSSIEDATRAYRRLAKKYHPDSNPERESSFNKASSFNNMMAKINEAYSIVKDCIENNRDHSDYRTTRFFYDELKDRYERRMKNEREKRVGEEERLRREKDALERFWNSLLDEKKRESDDKSSYDIIVKYTHLLLSQFFEKSLNNTLIRERSYSRFAFKEFNDNYDLLINKSLKLFNTCNSKHYRKKSKYIYEFLRSFLDDALNVYPIWLDRRASVYNIFSKAVDNSERFIHYFFSSENLKRDEKIKEFKGSLNGFEYFIKNYPESPLIEFAQKKIRVLEKLYIAFIKE